MIKLCLIIDIFQKKICCITDAFYLQYLLIKCTLYKNLFIIKSMFIKKLYQGYKDNEVIIEAAHITPGKLSEEKTPSSKRLQNWMIT